MAHLHSFSRYKDGLCTLYVGAVAAAERFLPQAAMRLALRTTFGLCASIAAQSALDDFVRTESAIAKAGLLANIGPDGSKCAGAKVRRFPFDLRCTDSSI
jgi:hypothetical protein